ncbi:CocE/NonD family hydrolase [Waterburya agarophytonicola K14]|uniref:CocE/NonD family hydrolase n=1 Tax=Waterburya agarophytonicola KI4 TaxID=2874699 RepID=A0A964BPC7_9CYAN|nr:CocE/NonD family hydrolase [Waterburya agarophytonicola]MCC0176392.1 CocE/NonD family hydrolase [Waterburya agarophytonicola KI4]
MVKIIKHTASMQTRDGVRLDADIYSPDTKEKLPILLMRQPYGREIASTVVYAHPRWYAAQGYIVVIQDVRGRGTSEGNFDLFSYEIEDGFDTIAWVSKLPNSNGKVGMYGFSYQGMTQLYAAVHQPEALVAIAPAMVAYDLYTDWAYENGAFCLHASLAWAIQLAGETARLKEDEATYLELYKASCNLPVNDLIPANPELMQKLAPDSFYHHWLNNPHPDAEYWQKRSPKYLLENIDLPMLHVGGWFDPYLRGTLNLYRTMAAKSKYSQHLLVGAWAHLPWGRKLGRIDYGIEAQNPIDEIQIRWFDYFLKGIDTGLLEESPISLFEMGSNKWREFDSLPQSDRVYYLASDGLASIREDSGMLWQYEEPGDGDAISPRELLETDLAEQMTEFDNNIDIIVRDPWRPVMALGGHATYPGGSFDRSALDSRSDILTYTSAPIASDLHIAGTVNLAVYCSVEKPSFDLCAVLSVVQPDGKVFNFTQGYITVNSTSQEIQAVNIPLQDTCMCLAAGNSLRLSISADCFPAYPVNPGTGKLPFETRLMEREIITIAIHSGADYPSQIKLTTVNKNNSYL